MCNTTNGPICLYVLLCHGGTYYIEATTDNLDDRLQAHFRGKGARYTRFNRPVEVLAVWMAHEKRVTAEGIVEALREARKHGTLQKLCDAPETLREWIYERWGDEVDVEPVVWP